MGRKAESRRVESVEVMVMKSLPTEHMLDGQFPSRILKKGYSLPLPQLELLERKSSNSASDIVHFRGGSPWLCYGKDLNETGRKDQYVQFGLDFVEIHSGQAAAQSPRAVEACSCFRLEGDFLHFEMCGPTWRRIARLNEAKDAY